MTLWRSHWPSVKGFERFYQSGENIHFRLFFIANSESVSELKKALHDDDIVISRGKQLEDLIDKLMGDPGIKREVTFDHFTPFKSLLYTAKA